MQVINVRFENGVFVPTEPVNMGEDQEAVIIISEKKPIGSEKPVSFYREEAARHFRKDFPGLEVKENVLELIGLLHGVPGKYDKEEYHEHIGRKYK